MIRRTAATLLLMTLGTTAMAQRQPPSVLAAAIHDLSAIPPDYERQRQAADQVARMGAAGEPALPALLAVLGQPVERVGGDVMSPVPGFEDALAAAQRAIRAIGAPAIPALIAAVKDQTPAAYHAVTLLGETNDARVVQPLVEAIGKGSQFPLEQALTRMTAPGVGDAIAARLRDPDPGVRTVVVTILVGRHDVRALPAIDDILKGDDQYRRWEAVGMIANLRPPDVRERLRVLLDDRDTTVRSEAASRLGDVGDSRDVPALIAALADASPRVRWGAARALGLLKDARALAPLQTARGAEPDEGNRQTMAASIAAIRRR